MPLFHYKAVSATGEMLEGEMTAPSESAVIERLHDMGHIPVRAESADRRRGGFAGFGFSRGKRVSDTHVGLVGTRVGDPDQGGTAAGSLSRNPRRSGRNRESEGCPGRRPQ